jgi:hypothetical protein
MRLMERTSGFSPHGLIQHMTEKSGARPSALSATLRDASLLEVLLLVRSNEDAVRPRVQPRPSVTALRVSQWLAEWDDVRFDDSQRRAEPRREFFVSGPP